VLPDHASSTDVAAVAVAGALSPSKDWVNPKAAWRWLRKASRDLNAASSSSSSSGGGSPSPQKRCSSSSSSSSSGKGAGIGAAGGAFGALLPEYPCFGLPTMRYPAKTSFDGTQPGSSSSASSSSSSLAADIARAKELCTAAALQGNDQAKHLLRTQFPMDVEFVGADVLEEGLRE